MKVPQRVLRDARDRFRALLQNRDTPERDWQQLFAECPIIFSSSLPVRIHQDDIRPLARPGRAETDFLFFPKKTSPLSSFGVIELKRADTRLIRIPRRDVLSLSPDAADAIAQARKYAIELKANPIIRPDELFAIGNDMHIFVIAGMSDEITRKVTNELLKTQFDRLLPGDCRIIPFDTLLKAFESQITPAVHLLNTSLPQSRATLTQFLREVEIAYQGYKGAFLSEGLFDAWTDLEKEFIWILGPNASYEAVIPLRADYEIIGSKPRRKDGRRPLALEAPGPAMFAEKVCALVRNVVLKAREFGIKSSLPVDLETLWPRTGAEASN